MLLHAPCEYYLKYLVSHPRKYTDKEVSELLLERRLDDLGPEYLFRIRKKLLVPIPFRPQDEEHLLSQQFLSKHRIRTLYFPDAATTGAMEILENMRLKEFVEAMLLVNALPILIARACQRITLEVQVTESAVRRFKHFFWNTDLLDCTDARALMIKRGNSPDAEYNRAHWKDSRRLAADMPFNPISAMNAQMKMGITPVGVEMAELMEKLQIVCGLKAYQSALDESKFSSENTRNFMAAAAAAAELVEKSHKAEELLIEKFNTLQIETDASPIPHIRMLSAGNHTTDLQPMKTQDSVIDVEDEA